MFHHCAVQGGSEKKGSWNKEKRGGGGNHASMHSAMFDSARVRGALRCYDAIDRVVDVRKTGPSFSSRGLPCE